MTDKPFKTISEQIELLQSRGMKTGASADVILRQEGYYSVVNGYKEMFLDAEKTRIEGDDRYSEGVCFDDLADLFYFDRDLRVIMLKYFIAAESKLRTACAYCFTETYSSMPEHYLSENAYRREPKYRSLVDELIKEFEFLLGRNPYKEPKQKRDYIEHYLDHHDCVPFWVLVNYLSLGQTFKFFEFQKESMRNKIAHYFSDLFNDTHDTSERISERQLRICYDHIKDFRNICAHDERFFCARVSPTKDTSFFAVLEDLEHVQSREESLSMKSELLSCIAGQLKKNPEYTRDLLSRMGYREGNSTLPIT